MPIDSSLDNPWADNPTDTPEEKVPTWQFPLDPGHEIPASPKPDGILTAAAQINVPLIPEHTSLSPTEPIAILLTDELKLRAGGNLWDQIQNALALLWWDRPPLQTGY
jgi:hypothetical protein